MTQENKLNILEISCRSDIGGGPEQLFKIITNLKDFFKFYCACPDQQPYFSKITNEEIPTFKLPYRKFEIRAFFELLKWTSTNNITIVHSHGTGAGIYSRLLRLFNRKLKVVHNFHGIHIKKFSLSLIVERVLKFLTNKFIFVSKSEQQIALKYGLTNISKCVLIENGIQINNGKYMEKDKSDVLRSFNGGIPLLGSLLRHKSFIIGMLSRFDSIKNMPYAIRTLSDYLKNHDDVFLIIGGDGEERKKIEQTIEQYNLLNKVILLGYVKDIQRFFLLIDVYLNTSYGEAFGLSTVEAMEYGKPVIASKVYGNTDVVDDNNTGLLFPLNSPSLLVERIKTLKNDKKIYDHLVENARKSVKKRFDLNRMLNETRELYLSFTPKLSKRRNIRVGINASKFFEVNTGVGRYTSNLCKSILETDGKNDYFLYSPGQMDIVIRTDRTRIQFKKSGIALKNNTLRILWEQVTLPYYSMKDRLDLFHYTDHSLSILQRICPTIITVHDIAYVRFHRLLNKSRQVYKKYILNISIKRADIIVADSYSTKRDIINFFGIKEEKIKVVYPGVERRFRPISNVKEYKLKNNLPYKMILNVGTLEPRKNVVTLVRAFKKLKGLGFKNYKLVIAGDKGWLYKQIFKEIELSDLQKEILFLGIVEDEDLPMLYNCADVFVYPSLYEGFGLPPLEAMACGIPVITSNTSSLPEVIGSAGIMIDPDDVNSLCEAMYNVLKDKELWYHMSKNGLERAKLFSWEDTAKKILQIYDEVLSKNNY